MILAFSRMKSKVAELEARADKALEQREKLAVLVSHLKTKVDTIDKKLGVE